MVLFLRGGKGPEAIGPMVRKEKRKGVARRSCAAHLSLAFAERVQAGATF